jgi:hypothetical protein
MNAKNVGVVGGVATTAGTGGAMVGATAMLTGPAANLGGYIILAKVASVLGTSSVAWAPIVAAVGGPAVVGAAVAVGAGVVVGGTLYGAASALRR